MDEIWNGAKQVLGLVAPALASAIGTPAAGMAVSAILTALDLDPATPAADIAKAVERASPDMLLQLKKADADFQIAMQRLEVDVQALSQKDRADARAREVAVRDRVPAVLAVLMTSGFFGLLAYLMIHEPPAGSRDVLNILLGSLASGWMGAVSYYFGSSSGSAGKDATIRTLGARSV